MLPPGDCLMNMVFFMKAGALTQADESDSYYRRDNRVNRDNLFASDSKVVTVVTVDTENCNEYAVF